MATELSLFASAYLQIAILTGSTQGPAPGHRSSTAGDGASSVRETLHQQHNMASRLVDVRKRVLARLGLACCTPISGLRPSAPFHARRNRQVIKWVSSDPFNILRQRRRHERKAPEWGPTACPLTPGIICHLANRGLDTCAAANSYKGTVDWCVYADVSGLGESLLYVLGISFWLCFASASIQLLSLLLGHSICIAFSVFLCIIS